MTAVGMPMIPPDGGRYTFDASTLFLEFLLTGCPGEIAAFDSLHGPEDLADWAAISRLRLDPGALRVTPDDIAQLAVDPRVAGRRRL